MTPKILSQEFIEEFGLYRKSRPDGLTMTTSYEFLCSTIQRHCSKCNHETTWFEDQQARKYAQLTDWTSERQLTRPAVGCVVSHNVLCGACSSKAIIVVEYGQDEHGTFCRKIGQLPAFSVEPPAELRQYLTEYLDIFKKGSICESQGYGIGAFAYYRRIVENVIDELLDDVATLLNEEDRRKYEAAYKSVSTTIVAADKIALVKDLLPSNLRPGNMNPLGLLHSALSVGIHALEEEECLELAAVIRNSLGMLVKHIAIAKQDAETFAGSMGKVKETLNRINRKKAAREDDAN